MDLMLTSPTDPIVKSIKCCVNHLGPDRWVQTVTISPNKSLSKWLTAINFRHRSKGRTNSLHPSVSTIQHGIVHLIHLVSWLSWVHAILPSFWMFDSKMFVLAPKSPCRLCSSPFQSDVASDVLNFMLKHSPLTAQNAEHWTSTVCNHKTINLNLK